MDNDVLEELKKYINSAIVIAYGGPSWMVEAQLDKCLQIINEALHS